MTEIWDVKKNKTVIHLSKLYIYIYKTETLKIINRNMHKLETEEVVFTRN